jgi:hypothetical protein
MSPLIRGGLFVVGFAGAVGLGYALKPASQPATAADSKPTVVLNVPPASPVPTPSSTVRLPAKIESEPELVIPPPSGRKPADEPVNKNDLAYKLIEKELGIKTTLDDKPEAYSPPVSVVANPGLPLPTAPTVPTPIVRSGDLMPTPSPSPGPAAIPVVQVRQDVQSTGPAAPVPPAAVSDLTPPPPRLDIDLPLPPPPAEPMPRLDPVPAPPTLDIPRIPDSASKPAAPARVILNTRPVSFSFEVTKVGLSKVKAVELWATRDGHRWEKYDRRAGSQSPLNSHFGGEGQYGFKLVFESESGMRTPEPGPGTKADVQAELDLSPPIIQMRPFLAGPGGAVSIRWTMTDKNLATDRTRIEYSPDGRVWHRITQGQGIEREERSTTGNYHFHWRTPNDLPHQLHVRVTAVDLAGNESSATLPQPSSIDLVVPEGKLTGVGTARATEKGPMPRVVDTRQIFNFYLGLFSATAPPPDAVLQIPVIEPAPDRGPNPVRCLREWLQQVTGQDPVIRATPRVVGVARTMGSEPILIYADGQSSLIPDALDCLLCLRGWPRGEVIDADDKCRMLTWRPYDRSWIEMYPDPSELRSFRDRVECNRLIADALSGGTPLVSVIADPDWAPSTAKPLPGRPWIVKTGMGLGLEW